MSDNLNITQVTAGQLQKDVTINEQAGQLDAALTEQYTFVGDVSPTLTAVEFAENMVFTADGAQSALITVTVPSSQKKLFLVNNLASNYDLEVDKGTTTVTVDAGATQMLYADGTADGLFEFLPDASVIVPIYNWFAEDTYTSLEVIATIVVAQASSLPENLSLSQAYCEVAPTADADIDVKLNGLSVGTISFAAAANVGTFTLAAQEDMVAGDVLSFEAPSSVDGTFADVSVSLVTI